MIAEPLSLDQYTLACLREADPVVQYYRAFFAFLDWSNVEQQEQARCKPGPHPHPKTAYLKAFLVALCEGKRHMSQLRLFLVQHPWLVLELGFHPLPDETCPYGFDVQRTVPTARWLRQQLRSLDESVLHSLFAQTVQPTRYATRLCNQDGLWVNRRDTGKRDNNCVFLTRERLILRTFPRKKTQKKYDTPFSSCPNCPNLCSLHALVARRSGRCGACVQPIGPPESH